MPLGCIQVFVCVFLLLFFAFGTLNLHHIYQTGPRSDVSINVCICEHGKHLIGKLHCIALNSQQIQPASQPSQSARLFSASDNLVEYKKACILYLTLSLLSQFLSIASMYLCAYNVNM